MATQFARLDKIMESGAKVALAADIKARRWSSPAIALLPRDASLPVLDLSKSSLR
ncbi:MAG: hypothetical protein R2748_33750 [Bryobacterales bacterium]